MSEHVRLEVEGALATIRLDRPKMNALNGEVQAALGDAAREAAARSDIRAVIVYGGERVFAAGADIPEMADLSAVDMAERAGALQDFTRAIAAIPKPTVAAITGYALGGGLEVALACDFRVLGASAQVGLPEVLLGIMPGAGGTQRLARLVGPARAKELMMTGRFVAAEEALALGIVDRVVEGPEPGAVYDAAVELVTPFLTGPAHALRAIKQAVDAGLEVDLQTGLEIERTLFTGLFATADQESGMRSFIESGPGKATFEGR